MGLFLSVTTAYPKINIGILSANIGILKIPKLKPPGQFRAAHGYFVRAKTSEYRQQVKRSPSLIGCGNRPALTPAHHALLLMGMIFNTWGRRTKRSCSLCASDISADFALAVFMFRPFSCDVSYVSPCTCAIQHLQCGTRSTLPACSSSDTR